MVISIIALLIAILLPSLQAARSSARTSLCLSNQRQLGIALNAYATDNDLTLPAYRLNRYWNPVGPAEFGGGNAMWMHFLVANGYAQAPDALTTRLTASIFLCPETQDIHTGWRWLNEGSANDGFGGHRDDKVQGWSSLVDVASSSTANPVASFHGVAVIASYTPNSERAGGRRAMPIFWGTINEDFTKLDDIRSSSRFVMLGDGSAPDQNQRPVNQVRWAAKHGNVTNGGRDASVAFLYADGHSGLYDSTLLYSFVTDAERAAAGAVFDYED